MVPDYKIWLNSTNAKEPGAMRYSGADGGDIQLYNNEYGFNKPIAYGMVPTIESFDRMWYPLSGYREPLTGKVTDAGWYGTMWTGMPMGEHNARALYYDTRQSRKSGQYANSGTEDSVAKGTAYGYPVRCMKE
jgi:hypothetical protein